MTKQVLSVGNCNFDNRSLTALIEGQFPAKVTPVDSLAQTIAALGAGTYDLVLVNRVLDRDGSQGLEVIRQIKSTPQLSHTPVMMITNFPDHQKLAQDAGALEGFGKQELQSEATRARLAAVLG